MKLSQDSHHDNQKIENTFNLLLKIKKLWWMLIPLTYDKKMSLRKFNSLFLF